MLTLNHAGVYRIIGSKYEILANVIGESPCFRIKNAIDMNAMVKNAEIIVLHEESQIIQEIYSRPTDFLFIEWEYSDVSKLPPNRMSIRGIRVPEHEITEKMFKEFTERYKLDVSLPGRGPTATKMYIVERTGWTLGQAHMVVMQIAKKLKKTIL